MRVKVAGTLVIKFPSVLEAFQSDKQLLVPSAAPLPHSSSHVGTGSIFQHPGMFDFTASSLRLHSDCQITNGPPDRLRNAFQKQHVGVGGERRRSGAAAAISGKSFIVWRLLGAKVDPSGQTAAQRKKLLQWADAMLVMENWPRTGAKSLGDAACLQLFMFQWKKGRKKKKKV